MWKSALYRQIEGSGQGSCNSDNLQSHSRVVDLRRTSPEGRESYIHVHELYKRQQLKNSIIDGRSNNCVTSSFYTEMITDRVNTTTAAASAQSSKRSGLRCEGCGFDSQLVVLKMINWRKTSPRLREVTTAWTQPHESDGSCTISQYLKIELVYYKYI